MTMHAEVQDGPAPLARDGLQAPFPATLPRRIDLDRAAEPPTMTTTTRRAACSCGQLNLTIEGEPVRISMCHCLECQRRTGAVISNQARFRREQIAFAGNIHRMDPHGRERQRAHLPLLPGVRLHRLLGRARAFPATSPSPSAPSPTRPSPRRRSRCGKSAATPGWSCRPTCRPAAPPSRADCTARISLSLCSSRGLSGSRA